MQILGKTEKARRRTDEYVAQAFEVLTTKMRFMRRFKEVF